MTPFITELTISTDTDAYRAVRQYWTEKVIHAANIASKSSESNLHRDYINQYNLKIISPFKQWLATQGVSIRDNKDSTIIYGVDSYNVACGVDQLEFDTEADLVAFLLRWS